MLAQMNRGQRNGDNTTVGSTLNATNSEDPINKDLNQLFASAQPAVGNRRVSQDDIAEGSNKASNSLHHIHMSEANYAVNSAADGRSASPDARVRQSHDSVSESVANGFSLPSIKRITVSKASHIKEKPTGVGLKPPKKSPK